MAAIDRVICHQSNKLDEEKKEKAIIALAGSPKKLINKVSLRI
jgi:hypothetical protein